MDESKTDELQTDKFIVYKDCRHPVNARTGKPLRSLEYWPFDTNMRVGLCPMCKDKGYISHWDGKRNGPRGPEEVGK